MKEIITEWKDLNVSKDDREIIADLMAGTNSYPRKIVGVMTPSDLLWGTATASTDKEDEEVL